MRPHRVAEESVADEQGENGTTDSETDAVVVPFTQTRIIISIGELSGRGGGEPEDKQACGVHSP